MSHEDAAAMKAVAKVFHADSYQTAGEETPVSRAAKCQAADDVMWRLAGRKARATRNRHFRKKWGSDRIPLPHRRWF